MEQKHTPEYAHLKAGVTGSDLLEAVRRSGYPLQAAVADKLQQALSENDIWGEVQEEWAYIDRESGQARALDVFADIPLSRSAKGGEAHCRLNILIECKQSELPYVFFLRKEAPQNSVAFPEIIGTAGPDMQIFAPVNDGKMPPNFSYLLSVHDALACHEFQVFDNPPFHAISLTKAARRGGSKLELTGEDAYRSITLPLLKSADHLTSIAPRGDRDPIRFLASLAVVDAPMIGTLQHDGKNVFLAVPWVRMSYLEPFNERQSWNRTASKVRYFDVVHSSRLSRYLDVLLKGVGACADRAIENYSVLKSGVAVMGSEDEYVKMHELEEERRKYITEGPMGRIFKAYGGRQLKLQEGAEIAEDVIAVLDW
ncbi:hypothetical protein ACF1G0_01470 [Streptomyces sp. NPDC013953]|uniref:hypothetical protein n=1 Tax=Streptomyces sp. NPDC013953 TaxID=3364868 RepID=UPI00370359F0